MYSFHVDNHSIRKDAGQRMRQHGAWLFPLGTKTVQGAPTLRFLYLEPRRSPFLNPLNSQ